METICVKTLHELDEDDNDSLCIQFVICITISEV